MVQNGASVASSGTTVSASPLSIAPRSTPVRLPASSRSAVTVAICVGPVSPAAIDRA